MKTGSMSGLWKTQKGRLKQKLANLTSNELLFDEGKKEEMLGKLQIKLWKRKELEIFLIH